jgi:hypothetical protein
MTRRRSYGCNGFFATTRDLIALEPATVLKIGDNE